MENQQIVYFERIWCGLDLFYSLILPFNATLEESER